jgi:hypothetical protein
MNESQRNKSYLPDLHLPKFLDHINSIIQVPFKLFSFALISTRALLTQDQELKD